MCKTTQKTESSQTQTSQQGYDYAPGALESYQSLMPQYQGVWSSYMKDPYQNAYFNRNLGQAFGASNARGARIMGNLSANSASRGWRMHGTPAFMAAQSARQQRASSGEQAALEGGMLADYENKRLSATGMAAGWQPLATGQHGNQTQTGNSTTTTGGLGTWLPQLIGAGLQAGIGAMTGGASMAALGASTAAGNSASAGYSRNLGTLPSLAPLQPMGPSGYPASSTNPFMAPSDPFAGLRPR